MTKKLGFGCMRLPLTDPENAATIDKAKFCEMVDLFLSRGFTYFDTAYMYHKYRSERAVQEAIVKRHPRESFTLATKMPLVMVKSREDLSTKFGEQLERSGAGYFDYYLLHNVNVSTIRVAHETDAFTFCMKRKEEGLIRKFGFSFHDSPELLDEILTAHPEVEFVQLQLNYLDWDSDTVRSGENYDVCCKHGKPVVVMEPVKGGLLANLPPAEMDILTRIDPEASAASWALRFAASLPNVFMVLSGMSSLEQLDENTTTFADFRPLNDGEADMLGRVADSLSGANTVGCTGCSYCTESCPQNIPIPKFFSLFNKQKRFGRQSNSWIYYENEVKNGHSRAGDCVKCGACAAQCPQHLDIPSLMTQVSSEFDKPLK